MQNVVIAIENKEKLYIKLEGVSDFDIRQIFDCGQCFRFMPIENSEHDVEYSGIAFGKFVSFAQSGNDVYIYNATIEDYENIWKPFLCMDTDYKYIKSDLLTQSDNPALKRAIEYGGGIRILRQDSFEALISFIISQNNNIPRIKKIIESLCRACGEMISVPEELESHVSASTALFSFPNAEALVALGVDGLFALKTGFRAKYIYDAASKISNGELILDDVANASSTDEAIDALIKVKGVGLKVASCALLFGFARYDVFPIDVWIKKVIAKYFSNSDNFDPSELGPYAGIAQQYLFYYERENF